jgi:multidrug efflux pump subunit AcrA (membrane-fusion protein)
LTDIALVLALAGILFPASITHAQRAPRGPSAPTVTLTDVKVERMNERVAAVGSARARQQVTLTTRVAGVISEVLFQGGQLVDANQKLVQLNAEPEKIAVETAEAQRAQAADTVDRYKLLNEGTVARSRGEAGFAGRIRPARAGALWPQGASVTAGGGSFGSRSISAT